MGIALIIPAIKIAGDIGEYALPIGAALYGAYKDYKRETAFFVHTATLNQIIVKVLKKTIKVPRPFPNERLLTSFPSGHAATAFLAVGFLFALDYVHKDSIHPAAKASVVALAVFVCATRYICRFHWATDLVAGAVLGTFFGALAPLITPKQKEYSLYSGII